MLLFTITIIPPIKYTQATLPQKHNSIDYLSRAKQSHPHQLYLPQLTVKHALSILQMESQSTLNGVSPTKTGPCDHLTWTNWPWNGVWGHLTPGHH